jgi:hypothetical protein
MSPGQPPALIVGTGNRAALRFREPFIVNIRSRKTRMGCACMALVVCSFDACGPLQESHYQETDADMLRLEQKLGQPDRNLSRELSELASQDDLSLSDLKQAATTIVTTRARFDNSDTVLAKFAVMFGDVEDIPIARSTNLLLQLADDLELGTDAPNILNMARSSSKATPNRTAVDAVQLVVDMKPYWKQVHELTGRPLKTIVLEKASNVMAIQTVLYRMYPGDPALASRFLRGSGLSPELLEDQYVQVTSRLYDASDWASIVDRFQRGETDVIFNELRSQILAYGKRTESIPSQKPTQ